MTSQSRIRARSYATQIIASLCLSLSSCSTANKLTETQCNAHLAEISQGIQASIESIPETVAPEVATKQSSDIAGKSAKQAISFFNQNCSSFPHLLNKYGFTHVP